MSQEIISDEQRAAYWAMRGLAENSKQKDVESCEEQAYDLIMSLTPNAKQCDWTTPTMFPLCPSQHAMHSQQSPLESYANNLRVGLVVSENKFMVNFIDEFAIKGDELLIRTHSVSGVKQYGMICVRHKNGYYEHRAHTFFEERGARKAMCTRLGIKWNEGDGTDDYC